MVLKGVGLPLCTPGTDDFPLNYLVYVNNYKFNIHKRRNKEVINAIRCQQDLMGGESFQQHRTLVT